MSVTHDTCVRDNGNVPYLKGLRFIYNSYPGLTTGATIVTPYGLAVTRISDLARRPKFALLLG